MSCASCGRLNRAESRFCVGCGKALAPPCPACGVESEPEAQFCGACGAALDAQAARAADEAVARKIVTVVFADLIGSTALHERLDAESARGLMERYYRVLQTAVAAHGGTVVKLLGDGVLAAFGVPRVAEDDAIRAVRAAAGMQQAFRELVAGSADAATGPGTVGPPAGEMGLRVAVNTGEVVVSADNADVVGDPVNVAARLQQEAGDGDVLIGEATRRLVRELVTLAPAGVFALKGRSETVAAYRVVSLERPAGAVASAFVGRDEELRRVMAIYDVAVAERRTRLTVILGSPGLGKSRLLDEVARRLGDGRGSGGDPPAHHAPATILTGRCEPAGGATFAPLATALRIYLRSGDGGGSDGPPAAIDALLPGTDAERARIAEGITALLAGTPAPPEETFFVVRRFLAMLAATRPVMLAIDDLQWAEPLLLDLLEHLVQWGAGAPVLVLAAARPDLRDARSSLASAGGLVSDVVTLTGLDAAAATRLAANVIGADALPAAVAGRVLAASEGNPLFVGELVRMLVNDGALKQEGNRWTTAVELATLEMPPTIHALLAARIERLATEDRTVLERAAVVGRRFSRAAVNHLLPAELRGHLDARLEALRRSELLEPDTGWFLGEPALRFHHGLTRDAAYRRVLKGTRAELHGRFADWIESRVGGIGTAIEHDETIGWHLEQAHQHLHELGPLDAEGRALGDRAARYLGAAGRRALARDDLPVAANLLGRALNLLDAADPGRADLALDWCEALLAAGDVGPAEKAVAEITRFLDAPSATPAEEGRGTGRLRAWHTCFTGQLAVLTDPQALHATANAVAAAAEELAAAGDAAGEAKAHLVHALALSRLGKIGVCETVLDKALAAARRAHDRRRANTVLANAPLAALWGPSPVTRASGRCLDVVRVLRITQGAPAVEAVALRCQAVLEALRGRTEAARRMIASSRRMVEELGITQGLLETEMFAGLIALIEGDTAAAEQSLRAAYDGLRSHGLGIDAARAAALLGRTLLAQGRAGEAEALSHESEALAGDDLQAAITWRRVRAEALAQRGMYAEAVDFARAAVDIAAATDALLHHADARLALAAALLAAGRSDEAAAEEARTIELLEAKGAIVLAERTRGDLGRVEQVERPPDDRAGAARTMRRQVRANAATANVARLDAAIASRDTDALTTLFADEMQTVNHHLAGGDYDRQGVLATWRSLLRAQAPTCRHEPLATLGDSLALCRLSTSASAYAGRKLDVGAYEREEIALVEVDSDQQQRRAEFFAADRLGAAVARLYERYAELLPDGPERERGAATARSFAALVGPPDLDRWATAIARGVESADHRTLGLGSARGAEAILRALRSLLDVADDVDNRADDVLALRFDACVLCVTNSGTDRAGGGAYERPYLAVSVFGADGLITHLEQFNICDEAEALARFDELGMSSAEGLMAEPPAGQIAGLASRAAHKGERRVRPNAATANMARLDAAMAARDADALANLFADSCEVMDHTTGATYDRQGALATWRSLLSAQDPTYRHEPLATLGNSLALCRSSMSGSSFAGGKFDVGAYEKEGIHLVEVDPHGRRRWTEFFAADRLRDAVARLYQRYAESLPEGSTLARAAATARAVAAMSGPIDLGRYAAALAPAIEAVDHRTLGTFSAQGAEALLQGFRSWLDLADEATIGADEILCLQSDAFLVRKTFSGIDRAGGGAFERPFIQLSVFGIDGLATRLEIFDPDSEAEALGRFDELALSGARPEPVLSPVEGPRRRAGELTAAPAIDTSRAAKGPDRRVRENAAIVHSIRFAAAFAARDADALLGLWVEDGEIIDHTTGTAYGVQGLHTSWCLALKARDPTYARETLATLGDALGLSRNWVRASAAAGETFDVGPYEIESITLVEVDVQGRCRRAEVFAADRLGDAIVRLYERYAALLPDGAARARAEATARSVAAVLGPVDLDSYATAFAPAIESVDHRILGTWSARGAEALLQHYRSVLEIADDVGIRNDDVLGLRSDALLLRRTHLGTARAGGGAYERQYLALSAFDADGLVTHNELFDCDREVDALARFDELSIRTVEEATAQPATIARIENAATRAADRLREPWAAGDWVRFAALFSPGFRTISRRWMVQLEMDRDQYLESIRPYFEMTSSIPTHELLATRGGRLALYRSIWTGTDSGSGPIEVEFLAIFEVDDQGELAATIAFDPDDIDAAYAELDERYAAGEAAPYARAWTTNLHGARALAARDWEQLAATYAPDCVTEDHRPLGLPTLRSRDECVASPRAFADLRPDATMRVDHVLGLDDRRSLTVTGWVGSEPEGRFEIPVVVVIGSDADGRAEWVHVYNLDQLDEARARFDALGADRKAEDAPREEDAPSLSVRGGRPDAAREPLAAGAKPNAAIARDGADRAAPSRGEERARRVQPNAATGNAARMDAVIAARDAQALPDLFTGDSEAVDHTTHTAWDRQALLSSWRSLLLAQDPTCRHEPLATLGDSLALCRWSLSASGIARGSFDVGAYEKTEIHLIEADAQGRRRSIEAYAVDRLGDAVVRLYERYAELLPEGPARVRAAATARSVAALLGPFDLDRYAAAHGPGVESADHRVLGTWWAHGAEALLQHLRSFSDLADHLTARDEEILTLRSDGLVVRRTTFGTDRAGGGTFEHAVIAFWTFGADGLTTRLELFDADREAEALSRFDELGLNVPCAGPLPSPVDGPGRSVEGPLTEPAATACITNAAARAWNRLKDAWEARDWERFAASFAPGFRVMDRRKMIRIEVDRAAHLETLRSVFDVRSSTFSWQLLATRGDKLAMGRLRFEYSDGDVGPSEVSALEVVEVDDHGDRVAIVVLDPDDLDAAYAELDERYAAGKAVHSHVVVGMGAFVHAIATRDWDAMSLLLSPDLVVNDHRPLGWETLHGPATYVETLKSLVDLAPDVRLRSDHMSVSDRGALFVSTWVGTREGGAFEAPRAVVFAFDVDGRIRSMDFYDPEQLDAARARFEQLGAERAA